MPGVDWEQVTWASHGHTMSHLWPSQFQEGVWWGEATVRGVRVPSAGLRKCRAMSKMRKRTGWEDSEVIRVRGSGGPSTEQGLMRI